MTGLNLDGSDLDSIGDRQVYFAERSCATIFFHDMSKSDNFNEGMKPLKMYTIHVIRRVKHARVISDSDP